MDQNLLSGLSDFGLGNLEGLDIYDTPGNDKNDDGDLAKKGKTVIKEEDMVFDKSFTCPLCDKEFKAKMVRAGKVRTLESDRDLRPRHENIDTLKYDIIACPYCGYAHPAREKQSRTISAAISSPKRQRIRCRIIPMMKPWSVTSLHWSMRSSSMERQVKRHTSV